MAGNRIRRKRYFVSARFQIKYIAYILLFLYIGAALAGYTVYYTTWLTLGEKLANVYPRGRLVYIFHSANMTLLLRLLLITPLFILIGTMLSHRIVGPIIRITKYIDSLKSGDYSQSLVLRKKDELKDIAAKMTELCLKLREDKKKRDEMVNDLIVSMKEHDVKPDIAADIEARLRGLQG